MGVLITTPTIMIRTSSMQIIFMFIILLLSLSKKDLLYINFMNVKEKMKINAFYGTRQVSLVFVLQNCAECYKNAQIMPGWRNW